MEPRECPICSKAFFFGICNGCGYDQEKQKEMDFEEFWNSMGSLAFKMYNVLSYIDREGVSPEAESEFERLLQMGDGSLSKVREWVKHKKREGRRD